MSNRDKAIDGWRAVAVLLVIFAHAATYRFYTPGSRLSHYLEVFAGPLSELGVQIFFVISGYIITSLLIREEAKRGQISIAAFYVRRTCRIIPPFLAYLGGVWLAWKLGWIVFPAPQSLVNAALFTCNTGWTTCNWWVAHSWSLAVEEQYYLGWPLLFVLLGGRWRERFLIWALAILLSCYWFFPHQWHSNFIAFACIAAGALYATSEWLRDLIRPHWLVWCLVGGVLVFGPVVSPAFRSIQFAMPWLVLYLVFAGKEMRWVRMLLESKPFQLVGYVSYSLYLWQQLFFAKPDLYIKPLPVVALLIAVAGSIFLIERPLIKVGHRLSERCKARQSGQVEPLTQGV